MADHLERVLAQVLSPLVCVGFGAAMSSNSIVHLFHLVDCLFSVYLWAKENSDSKYLSSVLFVHSELKWCSVEELLFVSRFFSVVVC